MPQIKLPLSMRTFNRQVVILQNDDQIIATMHGELYEQQDLASYIIRSVNVYSILNAACHDAAVTLRDALRKLE